MTLKTGILFFICSFCIISCNKEEKSSYVILISIDGFRHDYAEKYQATNLLEIIQEGSSTSSLIPCYPSKTFPNHYSIVTGMYPENHGIVGNYFYEPNRDDYYMANQSTKVQDGSWYGGKPLWALANQHEFKSATFFWVGSEAEINGSRPTYYKKYDSKITGDTIVNQIIDWLRLPKDDRPQLVNAYFSLVDKAGHDYGVDSPELKNAVLEMDQYIGKLREQISQLHIPVNLIIVSDHGMTNTNYEIPIYYEDFINLKNINHIYRDALIMIYSNDSFILNAMYDTLKLNERDLYTVYKKENIPAQYHFQNSERIGDLLLVANPPNIFSSKKNINGKGTHGYDPKYKDMHGVFFATGPNIKKALKINSFENIHIYPMVANLLNIPYDTLAIDGKHEVLQALVIE